MLREKKKKEEEEEEENARGEKKQEEEEEENNNNKCTLYNKNTVISKSVYSRLNKKQYQMHAKQLLWCGRRISMLQ